MESCDWLPVFAVNDQQVTCCDSNSVSHSAPPRVSGDQLPSETTNRWSRRSVRSDPSVGEPELWLLGTPLDSERSRSSPAVAAAGLQPHFLFVYAPLSSCVCGCCDISVGCVYSHVDSDTKLGTAAQTDSSS